MNVASAASIVGTCAVICKPRPAIISMAAWCLGPRRHCAWTLLLLAVALVALPREAEAAKRLQPQELFSWSSGLSKFLRQSVQSLVNPAGFSVDVEQEPKDPSNPNDVNYVFVYSFENLEKIKDSISDVMKHVEEQTREWARTKNIDPSEVRMGIMGPVRAATFARALRRLRAQAGLGDSEAEATLLMNEMRDRVVRVATSQAAEEVDNDYGTTDAPLVGGVSTSTQYDMGELRAAARRLRAALNNQVLDKKLVEDIIRRHTAQELILLERYFNDHLGDGTTLEALLGQRDDSLLALFRDGKAGRLAPSPTAGGPNQGLPVNDSDGTGPTYSPPSGPEIRSLSAADECPSDGQQTILSAEQRLFTQCLERRLPLEASYRLRQKVREANERDYRVKFVTMSVHGTLELAPTSGSDDSGCSYNLRLRLRDPDPCTLMQSEYKPGEDPPLDPDSVQGDMTPDRVPAESRTAHNGPCEGDFKHWIALADLTARNPAAVTLRQRPDGCVTEVEVSFVGGKVDDELQMQVREIVNSVAAQISVNTRAAETASVRTVGDLPLGVEGFAQVQREQSGSYTVFVEHETVQPTPVHGFRFYDTDYIVRNAVTRSFYSASAAGTAGGTGGTSSSLELEFSMRVEEVEPASSGELDTSNRDMTYNARSVVQLGDASAFSAAVTEMEVQPVESLSAFSVSSFEEAPFTHASASGGGSNEWEDFEKKVQWFEDASAVEFGSNNLGLIFNMSNFFNPDYENKKAKRSGVFIGIKFGAVLKLQGNRIEILEMYLGALATKADLEEVVKGTKKFRDVIKFELLIKKPNWDTIVQVLLQLLGSPGVIELTGKQSSIKCGDGEAWVNRPISDYQVKVNLQKTRSAALKSMAKYNSRDNETCLGGVQFGFVINGIGVNFHAELHYGTKFGVNLDLCRTDQQPSRVFASVAAQLGDFWRLHAKLTLGLPKPGFRWFGQSGCDNPKKPKKLGVGGGGEITLFESSIQASLHVDLSKMMGGGGGLIPWVPPCVGIRPDMKLFSGKVYLLVEFWKWRYTHPIYEWKSLLVVSEQTWRQSGFWLSTTRCLDNGGGGGGGGGDGGGETPPPDDSDSQFIPGWGTVGGLFYSTSDHSTIYAVSADHVWDEDVHMVTCQPSPGSRMSRTGLQLDENDACRRLGTKVIGVNRADNLPPAVDAALSTVDPQRHARCAVRLIGDVTGVHPLGKQVAVPQALQHQYDGLTVQKSGARTHLTSGRIVGFNQRVWINFGDGSELPQTFQFTVVSNTLPTFEDPEYPRTQTSNGNWVPNNEPDYIDKWLRADVKDALQRTTSAAYTDQQLDDLFSQLLRHDKISVFIAPGDSGSFLMHGTEVVGLVTALGFCVQSAPLGQGTTAGGAVVDQVGNRVIYQVAGQAYAFSIGVVERVLSNAYLGLRPDEKPMPQKPVPPPPEPSLQDVVSRVCPSATVAVDPLGMHTVSVPQATPLYFAKQEGLWRWSPDRINWMNVPSLYVSAGKWANQVPVMCNQHIIIELARAIGRVPPTLADFAAFAVQASSTRRAVAQRDGDAWRVQCDGATVWYRDDRGFWLWSFDRSNWMYAPTTTASGGSHNGDYAKFCHVLILWALAVDRQPTSAAPGTLVNAVSCSEINDKRIYLRAVGDCSRTTTFSISCDTGAECAPNTHSLFDGVYKWFYDTGCTGGCICDFENVNTCRCVRLVDPNSERCQSSLLELDQQPRKSFRNRFLGTSSAAAASSALSPLPLPLPLPLTKLSAEGSSFRFHAAATSQLLSTCYHYLRDITCEAEGLVPRFSFESAEAERTRCAPTSGNTESCSAVCCLNGQQQQQQQQPGKTNCAQFYLDFSQGDQYGCDAVGGLPKFPLQSGGKAEQTPCASTSGGTDSCETVCCSAGTAAPLFQVCVEAQRGQPEPTASPTPTTAPTAAPTPPACELLPPDKPERAQQLKETKGGAGGYYDPHNHFSGIMHFMSLPMVLPKGYQLVRDFVATPLFLEALAASGAADLVPSDDDRDLFVYSWMARRMLFGRRGSQAECLVQHLGARGTELVEQLETLRWKLTQLAMERLLSDGGTRLVDGNTERSRDGSSTHWFLRECLREFSDFFSERTHMHQLDNLLRQVLTASPLLDFDTAYVMRGTMQSPQDDLCDPGEDKAACEGKKDTMKRNMVRYTVQELIDTKITYLEVSQPLYGVANFIEDDVEAEELMSVSSVSGGVLLSDWATRHVTVRFLPMFKATMFAVVSDDGKPALRMQADSEAGFVTRPASDKETAHVTEHKQEYQKLMNMSNEHVAGVDWASPERGFYDQGAAESVLADYAGFVYETAKHHGMRQTVHIHVGEGFPLYRRADGSWADPRLRGWSFKEEKDADGKPRTVVTKPADLVHPRNPTRGAGNNLCWEAANLQHHDLKGLDVVHRSHGTEASGLGKPVHYTTALNNIRVMAAAAEKARALWSDFDEWVVFRFGHSTHTSFEVARQMARSKIAADCNLSSNLATSAVLWGVGKKVATSAEAQEHRERESLANKAGAGNERLQDIGYVRRALKDHSLLRLLGAGVQVTLGTDGSGVEHSSHLQEYAVADALVSVLQKAVKNPRDPEVAEAISLGLLSHDLIKYATEHERELHIGKKGVNVLYAYQVAATHWILQPPTASKHVRKPSF